jgi:hypothetical protein
VARGSTYLTDGILNVLRGTAYPLAATGSAYIGLRVAGTEVSAAGYARQAVSKAAGSWAAPSGAGTRSISNAALISFGPAGANWGTVDEVAVYDASTAGNVLYTAALVASKAINSSDSAEFAIGALTISEA